MQDPEQLKRQWQKEDAAALDGAVKSLVETYKGRKFLWWFLQQTGVGQQPYAGNALQTAFNCGTLDVGNRLLAEIPPEAYLAMMKEMNDERRSRDAKLDHIRDARRGDDFD